MARQRRGAVQPLNNGPEDDFLPPDRVDQIVDTDDAEEEEVDITLSANGKKAGDDRERDEGKEGRDEEGGQRLDSRDSDEHQDDRDDDGRRDDRRIERRQRDTDDREESYSRRVQRRINREIALRKRTETQLAEERAARQRLEQRIQRIERQQVDTQAETSLRDVERQIKEVAEKLAKAKEDNDTAQEVQLQIELGDLQAKKVQLQHQIEQQRTARASDADDDDAGAPTRAASPPPGHVNDWIKANRRWWNTKRWEAAHHDAIQHDATILDEINDGTLEFEPYSDEHFEELARRLKADYPELEIRNVDGSVFEDMEDDDRDDAYDEGYDDEDDDRRNSMGKNGARNGGRRPPMGGLGGREGRRERNEIELARRGKVRLSAADKQIMRVFKLDPEDPTTKKYYARERARLLLTEGDRGNRS